VKPRIPYRYSYVLWLWLKLSLLYLDFKLGNIANCLIVVACVCLLYGYDIRNWVKQRRGYNPILLFAGICLVWGHKILWGKSPDIVDCGSRRNIGTVPAHTVFCVILVPLWDPNRNYRYRYTYCTLFLRYLCPSARRKYWLLSPPCTVESVVIAPSFSPPRTMVVVIISVCQKNADFCRLLYTYDCILRSPYRKFGQNIILVPPRDANGDSLHFLVLW